MKSVLLTGASSGIGQAIAAQLTEEGHAVTTLSRSKDADIICDLSDLHAVQTCALPNEIDTVICNAGAAHFGHVEQLAFAQMQRMMHINCLSHMFLTKRLIPSLKRRERAHILFIGSEAALKGARKGSAYCASKFALRGFAQSLREECSASSISVSIIEPGMVRTPFYDRLDFAPGSDAHNAIEPSDIAHAVSMILAMRPGTVCDELILTPHKKNIVFTGARQ